MISGLNEQLRRIVLSGVLKEENASQFLEQITALECSDIGKPITLYIDTYGGSIDSALLIYDAIKACCCPILTVGIGKVMSAGVLLLAAGDPGNRFITQNTRVMMHEVAGGAIGSISDMEVNVVEMRRMQNLYVDLLSRDCEVPKSKIIKDMEQGDYYMSAEQAVKYGIADKMVPTRKKIFKKVVSSKSKKKTATQKKRTKK